MAINRKAEAEWNGNLQNGGGKIKVASGALEAAYSFSSRFENGAGTNPEELLGAAHAGCFTMALNAALTRGGFDVQHLHTTATVKLEKQGEAFVIPSINLETEADVSGIEDEEFQKIAKAAKENCPVSKVLAAADITLTATLKQAGKEQTA